MKSVHNLDYLRNVLCMYTVGFCQKKGGKKKPKELIMLLIYQLVAKVPKSFSYNTEVKLNALMWNSS